MTQQQHSAAPPLELVQQWVDAYLVGRNIHSNFRLDLATRAAQWGADQELEACIAWFDKRIPGYELVADRLRAARRPKLLSLKEQALIEFDSLLGDSEHEGAAIILRALEQLPDDQ